MTAACCSVDAGPAPAGIAGTACSERRSSIVAMSNVGSRCTVVSPASASSRRCVIPAEPCWVKALYVPRCSAGTVSSRIEKSRTCSSYRSICSGVGGACVPTDDQPAGARSASSSDTIWLFVELVDRLTEYGSVTTLRSTSPVEATKTSTSNR